MLDIFRTLPAILSDLDGAEMVRESVVFAAWRRIAGESLGDHAVPLKLDGATLTVAVSSVTWQRHLKDLCGQMVFKLNAALGTRTVSYIELQIDEEAVKASRARNAIVDDYELRRQADAEISPELMAAAAQIKDIDLRKQFLLAAGNCLVRKRKRSESRL